MASIVGAKPTRGQDGLYRIASPDIYFKLAFSGEPDSLVEALPEYLPLDETSRSSAPHVFNADELYRSAVTKARDVERSWSASTTSAIGCWCSTPAGNYTMEEDCGGQKKTTGVYRPVRGGVILDDTRNVIALSSDGETLIGCRRPALRAGGGRRAKSERRVGLLHQLDSRWRRTMKRRHFVGLAFAGAALWPAWLREAFAEGAACTAPRSGQGSAPQPDSHGRRGRRSISQGQPFRKAAPGHCHSRRGRQKARSRGHLG